jgi:hypothetical protein
MTKRYIEDVLPLGELNKYAQKGGGIEGANRLSPLLSLAKRETSFARLARTIKNVPVVRGQRPALKGHLPLNR